MDPKASRSRCKANDNTLLVDIHGEAFDGGTDCLDDDVDMTVSERRQDAEYGLKDIDGKGNIDLIELVTIESTGKPEVFRFLDLPREIRDNIYERIVTLDAPLSDRKSHFKCGGDSCAANPSNDTDTCREQFRQIRLYSTVCRQVHNEMSGIFFQANSWGLHRSRLRDNRARYPDIYTIDTQEMFTKLNKRALAKYFKHFFMEIRISPKAYVDMVPKSHLRAASTPGHPLLYQLRLNLEIPRKHILNEKEQCEMFRQTLLSFIEFQNDYFPKLQTLTLEISLHAPRPASAPENVFFRCGTTFTVKIALSSQDSVRQIRKIAKLAPQTWPLSIKVLDPTKLEPIRYMLSPLMRLARVQRVEVTRHWVVVHRSKCGDGQVRMVQQEDDTFVEEGILTTPMVQLHTYNSIKQMLVAGKRNFILFQTAGLKTHGIDRDNVIEIRENQGSAVGREYELDL